MKSRLILFSLLLATVLVGHAQLVLNPGDVWTYSFSTMGFNSTTIRSGGQPNYGLLTMTFSSFPSGATLQYEMFEGAPAGSSFRSGLITSGGTFSTGPANTWQDLNGSVRLSMLTGACTVASVAFGAGLSNPQNPQNRIDTYSAGASLTSPPPRLVVRRLTNAAEVSWWTNGTAGFVLERTNVLPMTVTTWPTAPSPVTISNRYAVSVSATGQSYFRLRK